MVQLGECRRPQPANAGRGGVADSAVTVAWHLVGVVISAVAGDSEQPFRVGGLLILFMQVPGLWELAGLRLHRDRLHGRNLGTQR